MGAKDDINMGLSIDKSEFSAEDFERFAAKVRTDLDALSRLLARPGFGEGESSIGAEVEFYIVNQALRAHPINTEIAASVQDPQLTVELNRFNLEYNLTLSVAIRSDEPSRSCLRPSGESTSTRHRWAGNWSRLASCPPFAGLMWGPM